MALYITQVSFDNKDKAWHVGEPVPSIAGRVVTFQADGDELEMILQDV